MAPKQTKAARIPLEFSDPELEALILAALVGKKSRSEVIAGLKEAAARAEEAGRLGGKKDILCLADPELVGRTLKWAGDVAAARKEKGRAVINPATGLPRLDRMLSGFSPGLWALLGTPGTGKTFFALHLAVQFLRDPRAAVFYVNYEEPVRRLQMKAWCNYAGLRWDDYEFGLGDVEALNRAARDFAPLGLRFGVAGEEEMSSMSALQEKAGKWKLQTGCSRLMVVLDYVQVAANLMAASRYQDDMRGRVGMVVSGLRGMANRMDAVVLAISALNRGSYKDAHSLSAGRESSDIEYSADVFLRLHAREKGRPSREKRLLDLHVLKNRVTGETGMVPLVARLSHSRFEEVQEGFDEEEDGSLL